MHHTGTSLQLTWLRARSGRVRAPALGCAGSYSMLWLVFCRRQGVGSARGQALAGALPLFCRRQDLCCVGGYALAGALPAARPWLCWRLCFGWCFAGSKALALLEVTLWLVFSCCFRSHGVTHLLYARSLLALSLRGRRHPPGRRNLKPSACCAPAGAQWALRPPAHK